LTGKSTGAVTRCGGPDGIFAVLAAQRVDALVKFLERLALVAIQQRLLKAGTLQPAGAHAEQAHGAAAANILPEQIADDCKNFIVETGW
jgi:hypothetical protein